MNSLSKFRQTAWVRNTLVGLNYLIVMFYASFFLITSSYIVESGKSGAFLELAVHVPKKPVMVFCICLFLFALLSMIILSSPVMQVSERREYILVLASEVLISTVIVWELNFAYSGLYLMIFADCLFHLRRENNKATYTIMGLLAALYFLSNYPVISMFLSITNPQAFFEILDRHWRSSMSMIFSLFEIMNIVLFMLYLSLFLSEQLIENQNIQEELNMINQVNQELKNYAAITEKIGESNERKRLAREIHDTLGHALTGIAAGVDACLIVIDKKPEIAKKQLQLVSQVVREGIGDVRNSLNKLRPGALEEKGLEGAIRRMIDEYTGLSEGLVIDFDYHLKNVDFDVAKEDALFRIIQESITNSIRHGAANHIWISMCEEDKSLNLIVEDNGFGCEKIVPGYGLVQMKERVAAIHGSVDYDGSDGFTTRIKVPLQKGEQL